MSISKNITNKTHLYDEIIIFLIYIKNIIKYFNKFLIKHIIVFLVYIKKIIKNTIICLNVFLIKHMIDYSNQKNIKKNYDNTFFKYQNTYDEEKGYVDSVCIFIKQNMQKNA